MNGTENNVLSTSDLQIGYRANGKGPVIVAENIDVALESAEVVSLLGPNGSGKSTLIRTLSGLQQPLSGAIKLFGKDLANLNNREIAKRLSTVLTDRILIGNLSVYSLVAFGRSPYTGLLGRLRDHDREIVHWSLEATGMLKFADRDIQKLSDGERQKAMIARALAQDTSVILLDEPTAHLDLPNRVEIIRLLRQLSHNTGKGILLSTHELDLALKASDQLWLMNNQKDLIKGVPEDLVLDGTFEKVFSKDSFDFDRTTGTFNIHKDKNRRITVFGDQVYKFWTARALAREGYQVMEEEGDWDTIKILLKSGEPVWLINDNEFTAESIEMLIDYTREKKSVQDHTGENPESKMYG